MKRQEKPYYFVHQCYISLGQGVSVQCERHCVSAEEEDLYQDGGSSEGSFPQVSEICLPTGTLITSSKQSAQFN